MSLHPERIVITLCKSHPSCIYTRMYSIYIYNSKKKKKNDIKSVVCARDVDCICCRNIICVFSVPPPSDVCIFRSLDSIVGKWLLNLFFIPSKEKNMYVYILHIDEWKWKKFFGYVYFIREISRCKNSVNPRTNLEDSINNGCLYSLLRISSSSQSSERTFFLWGDVYFQSDVRIYIYIIYIVIWTEHIIIICSLPTDKTANVNIFYSSRHGHCETPRWKLRWTTSAASALETRRDQEESERFNTAVNDERHALHSRVRKIWSPRNDVCLYVISTSGNGNYL